MVKKKDTSVRQMKAHKYGLTPDEQMFEWYRQHPVDAVEDLLGVTLTWYQRILMRELFSKTYCMLKWGRGVGKTSSVAMYLVVKAMLWPEKRIGVIAPSGRQTGFVFDEIERIFRKSPFLRAAVERGKISRSPERAIMRFTNGAFIEGLPIGNDGGNIRGRRYDIVFLDEFAQHNEETIRLVVYPFLAVEQGQESNQIIIASTPLYKTNHFYGEYKSYLKKSKLFPEEYSVTSFNFIDLLYAKHPDFRPAMKIISEQFDQMTKDDFMMEWGGFFPDEASAFFSHRLISRCEPRGKVSLDDDSGEIPIELEGDLDCEYVMGVDPARSEEGDNFALTIVKVLGENMRHVSRVYTVKGVPFPELHNIIRQFVHLKDFTISKICLDAGSGGGGRALQDLLMQGWSNGRMFYPPITTMQNVMDKKNYDPNKIIPILEMINFNVPLIDYMYTSLKADMEHQKILFPLNLRKHENIIMQDAGIEFAKLKNEMLKLTPRPTSQGLNFDGDLELGKDRVTSLVLANHAANLLYQSELGTTKEENYTMPIGSWV